MLKKKTLHAVCANEPNKHIILGLSGIADAPYSVSRVEVEACVTPKMMLKAGGTRIHAYVHTPKKTPENSESVNAQLKGGGSWRGGAEGKVSDEAEVASTISWSPTVGVTLVTVCLQTSQTVHPIYAAGDNVPGFRHVRGDKHAKHSHVHCKCI